MKKTVAFSALLFSLLLWSCGGDDTPTAPTPTPTPVATSITLSSTNSSPAPGATTQISATVIDQNGATMASATVTWATSDAAVATVSDAGLVTSVGEGTATITATSGSVSATYLVYVEVWASISAGAYHTVGIITASQGPHGIPAKAYAWGANTFGELGDVSNTQRTTPVEVRGWVAPWASISAGRYHSAGVAVHEDAYAWGNNAYGQLGNGTTTDRASPGLVGVAISNGGHTWASISVGGFQTVGITTSGDAYAWGWNYCGQLGNGTTTDRATPTLVSGGHTWASIEVGGCHMAGITTSGATYAWGDNAYGQLGDGTTTDRATPTLVDWLPIGSTTGGPPMASISAGTYHTVGITTSGDAYAWGSNLFGSVGDGTMTQRLTPTLVSGGHTWASIETGFFHTVGVTPSGDAYAWGINFYAQLGDGTTTDRTTPTLVSGGHTWASISTGDYHTVGLTTSGDAYAWGDNTSGQLGDGTNTQRTTPVLVSPYP